MTPQDGAPKICVKCGENACLCVCISGYAEGAAPPASPAPGAPMTLNPRQPISDEESRDLLQTMDGAKWANAFCRATGFPDEGWALAWFCNAIMATHDYVKRQPPVATRAPDIPALIARLEKGIADNDPERFECWDEDGERPNVSFEHLSDNQEALTAARDALTALSASHERAIQERDTASEKALTLIMEKMELSASHEALKQKASGYHRRAQQAEAAIAAKETTGNSLGRMLANAGYQHWKDRAEAAEAQVAALKRRYE